MDKRTDGVESRSVSKNYFSVRGESAAGVGVVAEVTFFEGSTEHSLPAPQPSPKRGSTTLVTRSHAPRMPSKIQIVSMRRDFPGWGSSGLGAVMLLPFFCVCCQSLCRLWKRRTSLDGSCATQRRKPGGGTPKLLAISRIIRPFGGSRQLPAISAAGSAQ